MIYIHAYIWLIFVAGKRSYIYLGPAHPGTDSSKLNPFIWYGKNRPPGICLVKWARYFWQNWLVRDEFCSLHESTKIPKTPVIW